MNNKNNISLSDAVIVSELNRINEVVVPITGNNNVNQENSTVDMYEIKKINTSKNKYTINTSGGNNNNNLYFF